MLNIIYATHKNYNKWKTRREGENRILVLNIHRTSLWSRDYSYVIFHETNIPMWLDTFRVTFSEQCVAWWSSYIKRAEILVPLLQIVIIRLRRVRSMKNPLKNTETWDSTNWAISTDGMFHFIRRHRSFFHQRDKKISKLNDRIKRTYVDQSRDGKKMVKSWNSYKNFVFINANGL